VQRLDGADEFRARGRGKFQHFAAGRLDRLARDFLFLDGELALREDRFARGTLDAVASSPEELSALLTREIDKYAKVIRLANIRLK